MCNYDLDPADIWNETRPRARKVHRCYECHLPIPVGEVHVRIGCLFEGNWDTYRIHAGCMELARFIDREMCGSSGFAAGGLGEEIANQDGGDTHHDVFCGINGGDEEEGPCLPACLGMSTRETLEWLWDLVKEPYRQGAA